MVFHTFSEIHLRINWKMGAKQTTLIANDSEKRVFVVISDKYKRYQAAEVVPNECKRIQTAQGPIFLSAFPIERSKREHNAVKFESLSGKKITITPSANGSSIQVDEDSWNRRESCNKLAKDSNQFC